MAPTRVLFAATLAAAALPASAQAAPHWSSPKQIVAPPADPTTQSLSAPSVLATPGGGLVAFGTDATKPIALRGTIASGFGAPVALGTSGGLTGGVAGAAGADGTLAAAWTEANHVKVAVAPSGGAFGAPVDLPGDRVNALDVAVGDDGAVTVGYRTRSVDNVYDVLAATAPRGGSFGAPQVIESGKGGVSTIDVAAGPGGATAMSWTRIASVYRTHAAVRPAGAAQFEPAQTLSGATKADLSPRVAFGADGSVVAAWANADGGQIATRLAGATQFGMPSPLGQPAFWMDLEPTPQGRVALAFSSTHDVFAGVQTDTGFVLGPVGSATGEVPPSPEIAVDAAGAPLVVYGDSPSGEVRAVAGGRATVIGYGRPGTLTPVGVAAVGAGRAVAVWHDATDGISSATYGDDAPPAGGPGPKPGAADRTAPKLTLVSSRRIAVTSRTRSVKLTVRCSEACAVGAQSELRTTRKGKRRVAPLPYVDYRTAKRRPAGRQALTLALGTFGRKDLRAALKAGRGAQLIVRYRVVDAAENLREGRFTLTLRAKAKKR